MKEHVLCNFSNQVLKQPNPYTVYDFSSQISYYDFNHTQKVIDGLLTGKRNSTFETSSIETSDKDSYAGKGAGTVLTENVENSDVDNFHLCGSTMETRGTETSDVDNVWKALSTVTTYSTENTDTDN